MLFQPMPRRSFLSTSLFALGAANYGPLLAAPFGKTPDELRAEQGIFTELQTALSQVATDVAKWVRLKGNPTVSILGCRCRQTRVGFAGGPGIVQSLSDELQKLGVSVQAGAKFGLDLVFAQVSRPDIDGRERPAGVINVDIVDANGEVQSSSTRKLPELREVTLISEEALVDTTGLSIAVPVGEDRAARDAALQASLDPAQRQVSFGNMSQTEVMAGPESPFGIEILVRESVGYRAKVVKQNSNRLATISIDSDTDYAVRLINRSGRDAAISLAIDGVSMFAFCDAQFRQGATNTSSGEPTLSHVVVSKEKGVGVIMGWFHNLTDTSRFRTGEYSESARHELGLAADSTVGTITAKFHVAWPADQPAPADEPALRDLASTKGQAVNSEYKTLPRRWGVMRAAVTVRYEKLKSPV